MDVRSAQRIPTLRDVAAAAGVSIATASGVMNHPEAVAPHTRAKVIRAITELGYRRNEAAASLRTNVRRRPDPVAMPAADTTGSTASVDADSKPRRRARPLKEPVTPPPFQALAPGRPIELIRDGSCIGRGVIDDVMSDGSAFWIWLDGAGRRLIHRSDGLSVLELTDQSKELSIRRQGAVDVQLH